MLTITCLQNLSVVIWSQLTDSLWKENNPMQLKSKYVLYLYPSCNELSHVSLEHAPVLCLPLALRCQTKCWHHTKGHWALMLLLESCCLPSCSLNPQNTWPGFVPKTVQWHHSSCQLQGLKPSTLPALPHARSSIKCEYLHENIKQVQDLSGLWPADQ